MLQKEPRKVIKRDDIFFIIEPSFHNCNKVTKLYGDALKNDEDHEFIIDLVAPIANKLGPKVNDFVQVNGSTFIFTLMRLQQLL